MSKATEVTTALQGAYTTASELVNVSSITMRYGQIEVLVNDIRDLGQIPGATLVGKTGDNEFGFIAEAWKKHNGVKFYTYMKEGEVAYEDYSA